MNGQQLELPLWSQLQRSRLAPESINLEAILDQAETEIAQLPEAMQMQAAGEAILQLAQLQLLRFEVLIDNWENAYRDPHVKSDFFDDIVRQTMAVDLTDLVTPALPRLRRTKSVTPKAQDSVVGVVNKSAVLAMVEQLDALSQIDQELPLSDEERKQLALNFAHEENIFAWCQAIASWIGQHHGEKVSLWQLQQALDMPLVEVWLGMLHSPTLYQRDGTGEFYRDVKDFWIGN
ncbi:hypothetical protein [Synechocystis sp. PCC 7509]|uniref:hypothetical protein n=1 Tax=Synechocystis sp. PCC 7509 TaxID=927677 RepID=UPI0002ABC8BB|nr:hypothetical protein [Synechocystis sp. PCC 7509]